MEICPKCENNTFRIERKRQQNATIDLVVCRSCRSVVGCNIPPEIVVKIEEIHSIVKRKLG